MPTSPITTLRIQGFKSLVDVQLQPRQLNLFIGKPNVGKSNILEALSLLGAGYGANNSRRFMEGFIRFEKPQQLFSDNQPERGIEVHTDQWTAWLGKIPALNGADIGVAIGPKDFVRTAQSGLLRNEGSLKNEDRDALQKYLVSYGNAQSKAGQVTTLQGTLHRSGLTYTPVGGSSMTESLVRRYTFGAPAGTSFSFDYLKPPGGDNLFDVVSSSPRLQTEIAALFEDSGLQFVLRSEESTFEVQKLIRGVSRSYPYSSIADTFKRLIFYLAAIESNSGAVLLFEEPEVNAFPPYVTQLAERIAEDAEAARNQYFIATHSPYLLTKLLEKTAIAATAVFVVDYEDYHTTVRMLTDEEIDHLLEHGSGLFWNLPNATPASADDFR